MLKRLFAIAVALWVGLALSPDLARAAPNGVINSNVAVCDPYYPNSCMGTGAKDGTDGSTTVTLGNTFQTILVASANKSRRACLLQNPTTATEPLYVYFGVLGSATIAKSYSLGPGMSLTCGGPGGSVDSRAVNVTAGTNGHAFTFTYQ